jgi:hypothetical protein
MNLIIIAIIVIVIIFILTVLYRNQKIQESNKSIKMSASAKGLAAFQQRQKSMLSAHSMKIGDLTHPAVNSYMVVRNGTLIYVSDTGTAPPDAFIWHIDPNGGVIYTIVNGASMAITGYLIEADGSIGAPTNAKLVPYTTNNTNNFIRQTFYSPNGLTPAVQVAQITNPMASNVCLSIADINFVGVLSPPIPLLDDCNHLAFNKLTLTPISS